MNAQDAIDFDEHYDELIANDEYYKANYIIDSLIKNGNVQDEDLLKLNFKKTNIFSRLNVHDSAIHYLEATIALARELKDDDYKYRAYADWGILLNKIDRPAEALPKFREHYKYIYDLPENKGNLNRRIISNYNLGLTYSRLDSTALSLKYLDKGLDLSHSVDNKKFAYRIHGLMAQIKFKEGKEWNFNLDKAKELAVDLSDTIGMIKSYLTRAEFELQIGDLEACKRNLSRADTLKKRKKIGDHLQKNFHRVSYKLNKRIGNYKKGFMALESFNENRNRIDSLKQESMVNTFNERQNIYEKKLQNSMLRLAYRSKTNKLTIIVSILSVITLLLTAALLYRAKRTSFNRQLFKLNKNNEKILENNLKPPDDNKRVLYESIVNKIKGEKLYLNSELSLKDIATSINTNTSYVSEAINQFTNANFKNLINRERIDHAKALISKKAIEDQWVSYDDIAVKSGFNSKTHFYRVFKQITGLTPNQYFQFNRSN